MYIKLNCIEDWICSSYQQLMRIARTLWLLLLLSHVSHMTSDSVRPHRQQPTRLPCPWDFSRQEYWSGLPFPSPMHESEKWKGSCSLMFDTVTPWTEAYRTPPSMGFSRQEYWSGVPLPSLKNPIKIPQTKENGEGWNQSTCSELKPPRADYPMGYSWFTPTTGVGAL